MKVLYTAMISGLSTFPVHFPDFEKKRLFHLRVDLPHSWVFPERSFRWNRNLSSFENHNFLREMTRMKLHCPTYTPPNFFLTAKCFLSLVSCDRRAEVDNNVLAL